MDPSAMNNPELLNFINQEKERAMVNEMVGKLTNVCWDKCITGTPGSKFSSSESACLANCARRYLDMRQAALGRKKLDILFTFHKQINFSHQQYEAMARHHQELERAVIESVEEELGLG
ncbi:mitochondrial import inner membrane translocase subunit TIM8-like [Pyrus ussuriensis x Pyrus communis]|uniref:Mitochondrial import inner membrane translocase subunit n=1 Tax=Pyrus ussuriensis x Pyrus communis TaxID=2448454 RepID=A0A5N5I1X7_9ROSA|nr:mitochondrial import inner membrane translocase subunit TIM8-like [Pyrus ussuriensis x Pyrus communis]